MNLSIKPLTQDLTQDYLEFFDNRAFADGNPNGPCYCTAPNMDAASTKQMVSEFGDDVKEVLRRYAVKLLAEGKIHGYLAFDGTTSVGWCNAGDLDSYVYVGFDENTSSFIRQNVCGKTLSVVCFSVAAGYHGKGIASALLARVCADAEAQGFAAVEGYARVQKERAYTDFNGPVRLFEKAGFTEAARLGDVVIMRKLLPET